MNIILYNINSFGGNYEYATYLFKAYKKSRDISGVTMLMPSNAATAENGVKKILKSDLIDTPSRIRKKLYFLYRSIANPLILYSFLKRVENSVVIFNDFDQLTSFIWVPLLKSLKKRHKFLVILHDPDRDRYFKNKTVSQKTMSQIMSLMDIAFYHGYLPSKPYYRPELKTVNVPHGIYTDTIVNKDYLEKIRIKTNGSKLIGVLGNIRAEKNYEIIIEAISEMDNVKLLIAGQPANSGVSVEAYKSFASQKHAENKVIWSVQYLDQASFNAAIEACDIIMLYYKPTFTSHSGVLNTIAPFKKKLITSNSASSLRESVTTYNLASIVPENDRIALKQAINDLIQSKQDNTPNWDRYISDSSWDKHVAIAIQQIKTLPK